MLIDQARILAKKYDDVFPHLDVIGIETVAIPVTKVEMELLGTEVSQISPTTEYLLRFISLEVTRPPELAEAMGLPLTLINQLLADEHRSGNIHIQGFEEERVSLTPAGIELLRTCKTTKPKVLNRAILYDVQTWKPAKWNIRDFVSKRDLSNFEEDIKKLPKSKKTLVNTTDIDPVELNRLQVGGSSKGQFDIESVRKVVSRKHGYRLATLILFYKNGLEADFVIDIEGERGFSQEESLRLAGGLSSIEVTFEPLQQNAINDVITEINSLPVQEVQELDPDEGFVRSFEHKNYRYLALESAKRRLLFFSPWISDRVVEEKFLFRLEARLKDGVEVTIGWGFKPDHPDERGKTNANCLKKMLALSEKYSNFNFVRFGDLPGQAKTGRSGDEGSHAKILVFDDTYIATSFNWLSFMGNSDYAYRGEIGEKRIEPKVVDSRYRILMEEVKLHSHKMTKDLIPEGFSKNYV